MRRERRKDLLVWENSTTYGQIVSFPHSREARGADLGAVSPGGSPVVPSSFWRSSEPAGKLVVVFHAAAGVTERFWKVPAAAGAGTGSSSRSPVLTEDEG